jgi:hypothetical protein
MKGTKRPPVNLKRRPSRGRDALIVGLGFIFLGLLFMLIVLPQIAKDFVISQAASADTKAAFEALPLGNDAAVYGELAGNPTIEGEAIVLVRERLQFTTTSNDSDWDWQEVEREIPLLVLAVDGGSIVLTTASGPVNLRGERHELVNAVAGTGLQDTFPYQDQRLAEGSTRTFTLQNGDQVTALGTKAGENELAIRELFGGTPAQLSAELAKGATVFTIGTWCLFGFGGLALLLAAWAGIRGRF